MYCTILLCTVLYCYDCIILYWTVLSWTKKTISLMLAILLSLLHPSIDDSNIVLWLWVCLIPWFCRATELELRGYWRKRTHYFIIITAMYWIPLYCYVLYCYVLLCIELYSHPMCHVYYSLACRRGFFFFNPIAGLLSSFTVVSVRVGDRNFLEGA